MTTKKRRSDYDTPWKEALEYLLEYFLLFFFPEIHAAIDWTKRYESLDKELHQLMRDARLPKGLADKLFKVWLKEGGEAWLLIHIEIQGQPQETFPKRMFLYNTRAFDRYDKEVVSLAVLTDEQADWRPDHYEYGRWGGSTRLNFLTAKLLDYRGREAALERDPNPFAQVVLAHLRTLATRQDPVGRKAYKIQLVRNLCGQGWSAERVRQLLRVIDWLMDLPPELQQEFKTEVHRLEEERRMPWLSSFERDAQLEMLQENIATTLRFKFGATGGRLVPRIREINDLDNLRDLFKAILKADKVAEVRQHLSH